jgi:hypothetical protein
MRGFYLTTTIGVAVATAALAAAVQVHAKTTIALVDPMGGAPGAPVAGVLQCVPFARNMSGIHLYGDAHTWWSQAEGRYARGHAPRLGAVMAIRPHGGSSLGHVATVSGIVDARTILISHANWSAPGKIERNVTAVDVSPANDWSEVRVWYAPISGLGGAHWPVAGFIYNAKPRLMDRTSVTLKQTRVAQPTMTRFVPSKMVKVRFGNEPQLAMNGVPRVTLPRLTGKLAPSPRVAGLHLAKLDARKDPIGAIISRAR